MNLRFIILLVFLSPIFAEILFLYPINIPGFPLTIGRISFILISFLVFISRLKLIKINIIKISIIILLFGAFLGNFYTENWSLNLFSYYGNFLLFLSAMFFYPIFYDTDFKKIFSFFIICGFFYWIIYLFLVIYSDGNIITYGELYRQDILQDSDNNLINYHSFMTVFSACGLYIYSKFFINRKISIIFIIFVLLVILISESRSNLIITAFCFYFTYLLFYRFNFFDLIKIIFGLATTFVVLQSVIGVFDTLSWRYRFISDALYYDQITSNRFLFYSLAFEHLINYPFGQGFTNNRVKMPGLDISYQPHNQYLTFILQAGFFSIPIIFSIFKFLYLRIRLRTKINIEYFSYSLIIFSTCFVNDLSGLNLFICLSIVQFLITYQNNEDSIPLSHSSH